MAYKDNSSYTVVAMPAGSQESCVSVVSYTREADGIYLQMGSHGGSHDTQSGDCYWLAEGFTK